MPRVCHTFSKFVWINTTDSGCNLMEFLFDAVNDGLHVRFMGKLERCFGGNFALQIIVWSTVNFDLLESNGDLCYKIFDDFQCFGFSL